MVSWYSPWPKRTKILFFKWSFDPAVSSVFLGALRDGMGNKTKNRFLYLVQFFSQTERQSSGKVYVERRTLSDDKRNNKKK